MTPFRPAPLAALAALAGSPALAHMSDHIHVHDTDAVGWVIGLALIALAVGVVMRMRGK